MDSDLTAFLIAIVVGALILATSIAYISNNNASIAKTALENGYCSSVSPFNKSETVWNKCEKETNP